MFDFSRCFPCFRCFPSFFLLANRLIISFPSGWAMHCSSQIRTPKAVISAPSSRALVCSGGGSGAKPCPNFFRNFCTTPGKMDSRGCNGMYYATMLCCIIGSIDNQEVSNKWRNYDKPLYLSPSPLFWGNLFKIIFLELHIHQSLWSTTCSWAFPKEKVLVLCTNFGWRKLSTDFPRPRPSFSTSERAQVTYKIKPPGFTKAAAHRTSSCKSDSRWDCRTVVAHLGYLFAIC